MRRWVKLAMAGLAALGLYALAGGGRRRSEDEARRSLPPEDQEADARRWDEVDEASMESFPASDPPSYSRGKM